MQDASGMREIESAQFRMPAGRMASMLFWSYGLPWAGGVLLLSLVCIVLGIAGDWRFFILFFMMICLVAPMLMAMLYFVYGLRPLTAFNSIWHKIVASQQGCRVEIGTLQSGVDNDAETETNAGTCATSGVHSFALPHMQLFALCRDGVILYPTEAKTEWLWLPRHVFDNPGDFDNALSLLTQS